MKLLLKEFLSAQKLDIPTIGVLDIGAMLNPHESKVYQRLMDARQSIVLGFEPIEAECDLLNEALASDSVRMLPYFIGDGSTRTFYETRSPMCSSLYEPNLDLVSLFLNIAEDMTVIRKHQVQTSRLDEISEINFPVDFIKIDIQGGELLAFEGGEQLLKNVTVIQTEAEWLPLYKDQPLFSELELYLRSQGFVVHKNLGFGTRSIDPFVMTRNGQGTAPQQLWSDVVFVRDFRHLRPLSIRQLLAWATVLNDVYLSWDMVGLLLRRVGDVAGIHQLHMKYISWVQSVLAARQKSKTG